MEYSTYEFKTTEPIKDMDSDSVIALVRPCSDKVPVPGL